MISKNINNKYVTNLKVWKFLAYFFLLLPIFIRFFFRITIFSFNIHLVYEKINYAMILKLMSNENPKICNLFNS